jgi:hypothetical protein
MKKKLVFLFLSILSLNVWSEVNLRPPHLGPWGLRFNHLHTYRVEKSLNKKLNQFSNDTDLKKLQTILDVSKKASEWINLINTLRSPEDQLDLSNPPGTNSGGIPYQKPMKSSTTILENKLSDFFTQTPDALKSILKSNDPLTSQIPIQDEVLFVKEMRKLDRIYQATIRFIGQLDWLLYYANREIFDVRGYLFFKEKESSKLEDYLKNIDSLEAKEKEQVLISLLGLCKNGDFDPSDCRSELQKSLSKNRLYSFYTRFNRYGESMYQLFFTLKKTRAENYWNEEKTILHAPFFTPESPEVSTWLKQNVEAEWSYLDQKLQIDFYPKSPLDFPQVIFKTGVTAHVNEVAGNLITMEAEYPINSPDQKWTIRHEYGHVLGFEDCYLEFYDSNEKAMVYYEIDVNNIMCSRNGKIQATHFNQINLKYLTKE